MLQKMLRPVEWIGSSKEDLKSFPDPVQDQIGFAVYQAQVGLKHRDAKPLRGLGSRVLEVVSRHDGDTYRAVYTVRFKEAVYVLHAFQKKAKRGIETPKQDIDLIKSRLKIAERHYKETYDGG
jgi:phage-related protein